MDRRFNTKELVLTGLMTALIYLAGSIIKIPSVGGFVHIGDCMVFLSVIILGKRRGAAASAVGMFLVDALGGYYIWAPFTFVIKGMMAYLSGFIIEKMKAQRSTEKYIAAFLIGSIFMVAAYFAAGIIVAYMFTERAGIIEGILFSAKDILGNIIQVSTGMIIAVPLSAMLKKAGLVLAKN